MGDVSDSPTVVRRRLVRCDQIRRVDTVEYNGNGEGGNVHEARAKEWGLWTDPKPSMHGSVITTASVRSVMWSGKQCALRLTLTDRSSAVNAEVDLRLFEAVQDGSIAEGDTIIAHLETNPQWRVLRAAVLETLEPLEHVQPSWLLHSVWCSLPDEIKQVICTNVPGRHLLKMRMAYKSMHDFLSPIVASRRWITSGCIYSFTVTEAVSRAAASFAQSSGRAESISSWWYSARVVGPLLRCGIDLYPRQGRETKQAAKDAGMLKGEIDTLLGNARETRGAENRLCRSQRITRH